jgi:hypothetical protein
VYSGSTYFLVLNRRMPMHGQTKDDVYGFLATETYRGQNEQIFERVITKSESATHNTFFYLIYKFI